MTERLRSRLFVRFLGAIVSTCTVPMCALGEPVDRVIGESRMVIQPGGFRFGFTGAEGATRAPMHAKAGLRLDGQPVAVAETDSGSEGRFTVTTTGGLKARVSVAASEGLVSITVAPQKEGACTIDLSLGGMPVAYGLGDTGGWNGGLNLVREKPVEYKLNHNGGSHRWLSSFVIFPGNRLAGVVFGRDGKRIILGPGAYTMSVNAAGPVTFHYLLGDMPTVYRNYRSLLTANGYPHVKPKFRLFELGWESWAALGYQTAAETVLKSVANFQAKGYPIRWAVTGSGFWEEGGTTTSFGKFGKKFPDPADFKKKLNERDVKWMIGLRTNFVLPGGPHIPKSKKRDFNLKGKFFNGNPLSTVGVEKGHFLRGESGKLLEKTSPWFPIVPCYLLDGRKAAAVDWYANLYKQWSIDGIKEDTMMNMGSDLLGIFDAPVARLADEGALVMARCGSFSAPGTLLRINDTHVGDMTKRTPINYLHYAACGAPNVYSDTVGFRQMKGYSEKVVRQGWLMALTAGLSVAEDPFFWTAEQQAVFKNPIDFHYRFGPYLYDAAMKSYETGYPATMTPLGVAYPDDEDALVPPHYQWMAGESLLCAPLVKNYQSGKMDIYLPEGIWFDYDKGKKYEGPQMLRDFAMPVEKTPCFVGGKGVLVTRESDDAPLRAKIFPVDTPSKEFTFHHPDGTSVSTVRLRSGGDAGVWNAGTGKAVSFEVAPDSGAISFVLQPGIDYAYRFETGTEQNLAHHAAVSASSHRDNYAPMNVNDGVVSDASRWLAAETDQKPWVQLAFPDPITVGMIDVFSGWKTEAGSVLASYDVAVMVDGRWLRHADWEIRENTKSAKRIYIDRKNVSTLRLELAKRGAGRIREIAVYDNKEAQGLKDVGELGNDAQAFDVNFNQHQIGLNQIGYLTERPKRFTAPLSADGTEFRIRERNQTAVLYQGIVEGGIGDFTAFKPADSDTRYVIDLSGGELAPGTSDPFLLRKNLDREQYWQTATDFLNDVRSVTGTHPSAYGGCAFRDGTYYDAIVPALVKFYLADPAFIDAMPRQIDWEADKARVTAPGFAFDDKNPCSGGVMDAVRNYYELEPPHPNAPDVVKLIHWGAGYILMKPNGRDPSSGPDRPGRIESQTVEQVAYVLWAWPALKHWIPQSFYDRCRDFCFKHWKGSLEISPHWDPETYTVIEDWRGKQMHPFKGRHAPGHSIVPNLLMHEVALREGRGDAAQYLDAAVKQAEWIIENLDWKDPRTTKGHRLSEHRTIPNLVWLLQKYPDQAPDGLKEKITEWARVAVSRSHNLWDFRKFSREMWTIPGMNEVGNSLSLPAIYTAASWVVDDPALKQRLEELAYASIDHVFGRNPMLHAAPSHPTQGFPEIERGWPRHYKLDVCARLEGVRGNIASMPGSEMYPFSPGKKFRHLEGWANYGASWCISLAYLRYDAAGTTPDMAGE